MAKEYNVTVTPNDDATVSIEGTIFWDAFSRFEERALERLGKHVKLDGFREGHVPQEVLKKHLGDELILADMAELTIQEFYPTILKEEHIDAIGRPALSLTKIARGNELGFSIRTAVLPTISLPEYKTIAASIPVAEPAAVTEEDVQKVVENLRHMRAYGHVHEEGHDHKHEEPLPEVNDEFAKSFGEFKSIDELRAKIRENIGKEKVHEASDKRRAAILDAIIEKASFTVPEVIIESEQDKLYAQIEGDIARSGLSMDEYLQHMKKTKDELVKELRPDAEKRARMQLLVNAIAKNEKIAPNDEEVATRAEAIIKMYPDIEKARAEAYADMVLTNEKVIDMLEHAK